LTSPIETKAKMDRKECSKPFINDALKKKTTPKSEAGKKMKKGRQGNIGGPTRTDRRGGLGKRRWAERK